MELNKDRFRLIVKQFLHGHPHVFALRAEKRWSLNVLIHVIEIGRDERYTEGHGAYGGLQFIFDN